MLFTCRRVLFWGGCGNRVKAYMVDSTGAQSVVKGRSLAYIKVCGSTDVGGATQVSATRETAAFYSGLT